MKILITGGHLTAALALLPLLTHRHNVLFIGRKYAFEADAAPSFEYETMRRLGIPFRTITTGRLQRRFSPHTIPSLMKFPIGFLQSFFILFCYRPQLILSFGGYIALPVCIAAFLLGIPIVTHEQTSAPGLANRIISIFAKKICISFAETRKYFPSSKTVLTGNPVRKELFKPLAVSPFPSMRKKQNLPMIYVTGGSGGSHSINTLIASVLEELVKKYIIIHQTGDSSMYMDFVIPTHLRSRYIDKKHITEDELAWIYAHAGLLIGRSGANTVYEILTFGLPAVLIPLPWAGFSEQEANAKLVENIGLGKVLKQEELTPSSLLTAISEIIKNNKKYKKRASAAMKLVIPNADEKIIAVLENASAP